MKNDIPQFFLSGRGVHECVNVLGLILPKINSA